MSPSRPNFLSLVLLLCLLVGTEASRILFFIGGITSHSHRSSIHPLAVRLGELGHDVTFHSPLKMSEDHPKVKEFCSEEIKQFLQNFQPIIGVAGLKARIEKRYTNVGMKDPKTVFDMGYDMCNVLLSSPSTLKWMDESKWDLIIMDSAMNECVFGIAHYTKAKTIIYGSLGSISMWEVEIHGLPAELSWIPSFDSVYHGQEMGFLNRLYNAYVTYRWSSQYLSYHLPQIDKLIREKLGHRVRDMPYLEKVVKDTSLIFVNQHYSDQFARPYPPFVVPIGGMSVDDSPNGTLPKEIEAFIQKGGDNGFIYISFGSIVRISTISDSLLQVFFDAIRKSNLRFLWKWEGELPKNPPENIYFQKWFPQLNILAHNKIRGFLMQGGHVSVQQGICHGVPLIILPTGGDQDYSAKRMRVVGNGIELEYSDLTSAELGEAFHRIVNVPSYKNAAKKLATACRDRPMSALDTAIWWIEYVLRTEDTSLLKPLSGKQPLWMYWCLDIWAFVFFTVLIASGTILGIIFSVVKYVFSLGGKKDKKPEKLKAL